MRKFVKLLLISGIILYIGVFIITSVGRIEKNHQVEVDKAKLEALYPNILDGISTGPTEISIDYSAPISKGSPLIFGGSHAPDLAHQDVWDKLNEVGVTSIRKDFFPENALPKNISLQDYKDNKDDVQNPTKWNQKELNKINDIYKNAHSRGIKTIGIASYSPSWLNHSNTIYGVPKDWNVYKDIVKKTYSIYRDNLDFVEIWNEPSYPFFLDLKGSNLSREEAYKMIFKTATEALREVDEVKNDGRKVRIGGPASHTPFETSTLEVILQDPVLAQELDFISFHNYESDHLAEPSDIHFRSLMKKYRANDKPVFITEWSYTGGPDNPHPYNTSNQAIFYTGSKFINFLKMGVQGANYHVLEQIDENLPNSGQGTNGFYRWRNGSSDLLPQAKTWRLLSKQMKLGSGISDIYNIESNADTRYLTILGFKNIRSQFGIAISNESTDTKVTDFKLNNTDINQYAEVEVYYASKDNDATKPVYSGLLKTTEDAINFKFPIPPETVVGILITEDTKWYNSRSIPLLK